MSPFIPRDGKEKKKYKDSKNPRTQFKEEKSIFKTTKIDLESSSQFLSQFRNGSKETNDLENSYVERERENERFSKFLNKVEFSSESYGTRSTPINFRHFERSQRTLQRAAEAARPCGRLNGEFSGSSTMQIRGARRKTRFLRKDITVGNATFARF